jgi:hypothetical protein
MVAAAGSLLPASMMLTACKQRLLPALGLMHHACTTCIVLKGGKGSAQGVRPDIGIGLSYPVGSLAQHH